MYDVTKRAGEMVIEAQRRAGGPEATSLRFATPYGPGKGARYGGASVLSELIEAVVQGGEARLERGGDQVDDVIWVGDARKLLEHGHVELAADLVLMDVAGELCVDAQLALELRIVARSPGGVGHAHGKHREALPEHVVVT